MKPNWPLLALAVGAFGIGTTEFAPMGMLPVIASGLKVSVPAAGLLVTAYALGVVAGAPLLTLTTARVNRKLLLIGLILLFTLGNLLSAVAPGYVTLLAARVLTALCHGAYFGVGSLVAAKLAESGAAGDGARDDAARVGRPATNGAAGAGESGQSSQPGQPHKTGPAGAVAAVFSGLTIANIGGVPLAAWVAAHIGWRAAFGGIAGLGVIALVALALALPSLPADARPDFKRELSVTTRREVVVALLTTAFGSAAMFTVFTYIAPILQGVTHAGPNVVTIALVVYGVGLSIGNRLGGRFADRALVPTLIAVLVVLTLLLLLFAATMHAVVPAVATIFAWGVATFALVPPLQAQVMTAAKEAPTLASSLNIGAFNLGNAAGAALGGGIVALGLSYELVSVAGAAMAAIALALVIVPIRRSN